MNLMENIEYGWMDKQGSKHKIVDENYSDNYILQSPNEIIKNKVGVCDKAKCPTHTFLTFEKDNKYYWFEHSWERFKGIHEYNSLQDLLINVRDKFIKYELNNNYKKPKFRLNVLEFYKHCENGNNISLGDM